MHMKLPQSEIKKIAIFRALQLGDMLCSIPAIRALRNAYPQAHITLIGLPWAKALPERFPQYFNAFKPFPGYPGLPEQPFAAKAFTTFLMQIQQEEYDLVLQMQGNGSLTNSLVALFNGKHTAGFYLPHHYCPDRELFVEYPSQLHEVERHLELMQKLGIAAFGTQLEFPLTPKDIEELALLQLPVENKKYICLHPGSRDKKRQWPPERFAALADYCAAQGLTIVLTGTKDELDIVSEVTRHMQYQSVIAAGKTSIGAVGVLIKNALLLISNCTGVSHIAAAVQTPSVIISMDGEPYRWAPLNKDLHPTIDWTTTPDFAIALEKLKGLLHQHMAKEIMTTNP